MDLLIVFIVTSALLALVPGPDNLFVLMQSALYGPKAGIIITLGLCTGLLIHTSAVVLGVAALIQTKPNALVALKVLGALYLLFLAGQLLLKSSHYAVTNVMNKSPHPGMSKLYRRGIIMNITNPKIMIFFLAFLPQFVDKSMGSIQVQLIVLGALFILVALIVFTIISVLSGWLGVRLRESPKAGFILNKISGLVFIGLALKLVFTK